MSRTPDTFLVDVFEGPQDYLLVAELPGVESDHVNVQLDGRELTLQVTDGQGTVVGQRSFTVPDGLDPEGMRAELRLGQLELRLEKGIEKRVRRIQVTSA